MRLLSHPIRIMSILDSEAFRDQDFIQLIPRGFFTYPLISDSGAPLVIYAIRTLDFALYLHRLIPHFDLMRDFEGIAGMFILEFLNEFWPILLVGYGALCHPSPSDQASRAFNI